MSLITGNFLRKQSRYFPSDGRADVLLLKNLRHVRRQLIESGLDRNVCHDLLARIIFTQFLFHRKDRAGNPFFSKSLLAKRCHGSLTRKHAGLGSILQDKDETYALFSWLDGRFNGDLFPGADDQTDAERRAAWQAEKDVVKQSHLKLLADLVSGTIDTTDRQLLLWPMYAFDTIPLEFISSVYEEFLTEDRDASKAYYTPSHLVDYVLDAVLPWEGDDWNLRILDPACGSGIFLVKAFQRLIHRWRREHRREPLVRDLKPLLANNFYGVDLNPDAVRVACFSLYLAMADAIDPKHYVTRERVFPRLRGTRLLAKDFFDETTKGFRTAEETSSFDLVIGNAPWGKNSVKDTSEIAIDSQSTSSPRKMKDKDRTNAEVWAKSHNWPIANNDIGPLFLSKALHLVTDSGRVALIQPAPPWLYHQRGPAKRLRRKLFTTSTIEEITNLSAVRRELFSGVIGPSLVLVAGKSSADPEAPIYYVTPKPSRGIGGGAQLSIDHQDISRVTHAEATDPHIWSVLSLGGQRDLNLIRRLSRYPTLDLLEKNGELISRSGIIPGDEEQELPSFRGMHHFEGKKFPSNVFLHMEADTFPEWDEPRAATTYATDQKAFGNPQLLIKVTPSTSSGRFRAARVMPGGNGKGIACKKTFLSVRDFNEEGIHVDAACLAYNSAAAAYFLKIVSGRSLYNTELLLSEIRSLPIPKGHVDLSSMESFSDVDGRIRKAFALSEADWICVSDFLECTLPDVQAANRRSRVETRRIDDAEIREPELSAYVRTLIRVLKSTFGKDKSVAATIYQEPDDAALPVRMITVHLGWAGRAELTVDPLETDRILDNLASFHHGVLDGNVYSAAGDSLTFQRVAFFFHSQQTERGRVRNLTIIKPDQCRYWTRSQAMRDADELASAIMQAAGGEKARP